MAYFSQYEVEVMLSRAALRDKVDVADDGDGWFDLTVRADTRSEAESTKVAIQVALSGVTNFIIKADYPETASESGPFDSRRRIARMPEGATMRDQDRR